MRVRYTDFVWKKAKENNTAMSRGRADREKKQQKAAQKLKFIAAVMTNERSTLSLSYQYNHGAYNFIFYKRRTTSFLA